MIVHSPHGRRAFTLVELVVVMGIVAVVVGLALAAVQKVRLAADRVRCLNNQRQLGLAAHAYAAAHGSFPPAVVMPYADASLPFPYNLFYTDRPKRQMRGTCGEDRLPFGPNWAVLMLPYLEQEPLYQQANIGSYPGPANPANGAIDVHSGADYWKYDLSWRKVRSVQVVTFLCPSDRGNETLFTPDAQGYGGDAPADGEPSAGQQGALGQTGYAGANWARGNYAANAGPSEWSASAGGATKEETLGQASGVMCINWGARPEGISDGSSNTILFNELRIGVNSKDRRGVWALGFPGSSVTAGHAGTWSFAVRPNDHSERSDRILDCRLVIGGDKNSVLPEELTSEAEIQQSQQLAADGMGCDALGWYPPVQRDQPNTVGEARGRHPGGVTACFADGSGHFINDTVDPTVWFYMNSASDGESYHADE